MARAVVVVTGLIVGCAVAPTLPPRAVELNTLGVEALAAGDLELADARFSLALEYSPRFVEALVNLGLLECQRGNFVRARQLLERALRLNADVAQPHHGLGILAEREGRPDRAADHYREALRVDPGFAPARANLGRLLFDAGELEAARIAFQRLIEIAPELLDGHIGLAESLLRLGRVEEADRAIAAASRRALDAPALTILRARALLRAGQAEAAMALLAPLAAERGDFTATALAWLATAELARGEPRRAVGAAERALALDPREPVAIHALARALAELGDPSAGAWLELSRRRSATKPR